MSDALLWQLAYHLAGPLISGPTPAEPLGSLPVPLRTAVIKTVAEVDPHALEIELRSDELVYNEGKPYEWFSHWRYKQPALAEQWITVKPEEQFRYPSLAAYFDIHNLTARADNGSEDEHYAERLFVERCFLPVFGLNGLSYLRPQVQFVDTEGKSRRIDFVLEGHQRYALEIEGYTYHGRLSPQEFEDEKQRSRGLPYAGYLYTPVTLNDIYTDRAAAHLRTLATQDRLLASIVLPEQADAQAERQRIVYLERLLHRLPQQFAAHQKLALALFWEACSAGKSSITIATYQASTPALALALFDIAALIEHVATLYGFAISLPCVDVYFVDPRDTVGLPKLLHHYLGTSTASRSKRVDAPCTFGTYSIVAQLSTPPDYMISEDGDEIERLAARFLALVSEQAPQEANPVATKRVVLDHFARRYFPIPQLKPEQVLLLQRALRNESGLGILPTSFGKSLIFQLYALLVPRTTLVISPLRALIRDQVYNLQKLGLTCVEAITFADTAPEKVTKQRAFATGKLRLLYVAPERLQIKSFYTELKQTMQHTPVGALVIDEAHCVSEWGHDFRPAYLQIAHVHAILEQATGRAIPIIALTATASPLVRRDILDVLGLPTASAIQLSSSDRPNISLSVHAVPKPDDKATELAHLMQAVIPRALDVPLERWVQGDQAGPHSHAGVVFGIYANAHGRTTRHEGVHQIAAELKQRVLHRSGLAHVHASGAAEVCPHCYSPLMSKHKDDFKCEAPSCKARFKHPLIVAGWNELINKRQDRFQNNEFPFLVATKGYGMGIDKRNIRMIVHHALSSGLEGYFQEAGRAGRDGQHAHAALMYIPPHPICDEQFIAQTAPPPCVADRDNYHFRRCPFYERHLCDYGHQARFIQGDYPGIAADVALILDVYKRLAAGHPLQTTASERESNKQDLALYRLQQLGIVQEYALEYQSFTTIKYDVMFDHNFAGTTVCSRLRSYLIKTGESSSYAEEQLRPVAAHADDDSGQGREKLVAAAVHVLIERIYATVPRTRYQMLRNELDYARSNERQQCRRIHLRSVFDDPKFLPTEDYRCGFCDVCVPDLKLTRKAAYIPLPDAQVDDLIKKIPAGLASFDPVALAEIMELTIQHDVLTGVLGRITNYLEHVATNPAALYLAGALERRRPGREVVALDHLRYGFAEGIRQGLPAAALLLFYREAALLAPDEAYRWLTRAGGPWDNQNDLLSLLEQTKQQFGATSGPYRTLRTLWQARAYGDLSTEVDALQPLLAALQAGFEHSNL